MTLSSFWGPLYQTLATFLYWLVHKMSLERIIEQPLFDGDFAAVYPSAIAPAVPRIKVSVDEAGTSRAWPWPNETRKFE